MKVICFHVRKGTFRETETKKSEQISQLMILLLARSGAFDHITSSSSSKYVIKAIKRTLSRGCQKSALFFLHCSSWALFDLVCVFISSSLVHLSCFLGTDLPRRGTLPVKTQPDSADSLPNWLFWRMPAWRIIITWPTTTWRRVRWNVAVTRVCFMSVCVCVWVPLVDWGRKSVCVCFIPVAQRLMDKTGFFNISSIVSITSVE